MKNWTTKATRQTIDRTIAALKANGIEAVYAATKAEAKAAVLGFIPKGAEVLTNTSITLDELGLSEALNDPKTFDAVRPKLMALNPQTQGREQRKLGAAPDFAVGSVHAVTESGTVLIASLTGSQIPGYAYAAGTVVWVVGAQKIVKDAAEGMQRIHEYLIDKESTRARAAYGLPAEFKTFPSRVLHYNREMIPGRVKLVIVDEVVGH